MVLLYRKNFHSRNFCRYQRLRVVKLVIVVTFLDVLIIYVIIVYIATSIHLFLLFLSSYCHIFERWVPIKVLLKDMQFSRFVSSHRSICWRKPQKQGAWGSMLSDQKRCLLRCSSPFHGVATEVIVLVWEVGRFLTNPLQLPVKKINIQLIMAVLEEAAIGVQKGKG